MVAGWPGGCHDSRVFQNSGIYKKIHEQNFLGSTVLQYRGTNMPYYLIGDSAYTELDALR